MPEPFPQSRYVSLKFPRVLPGGPFVLPSARQSRIGLLCLIILRPFFRNCKLVVAACNSCVGLETIFFRARLARVMASSTRLPLIMPLLLLIRN